MVTNSCFIENDFYGYGTVEIFDQSSYQLSGNYLSPGDAGLRCPFAAYDASIPTVRANVTYCLPADATTCQASIYKRWLASQSNSTVKFPTKAPTRKPTSKPSSSNSTKSPTQQPMGMLSPSNSTKVPSRAPTLKPSSTSNSISSPMGASPICIAPIRCARLILQRDWCRCKALHNHKTTCARKRARNQCCPRTQDQNREYLSLVVRKLKRLCLQ